MSTTTTKRAMRIAGASGSASDRRHAILSLAKAYPDDPVDLIIGDWLSEANMTSRAWSKVSSSSANSTTRDEVAYEPTFLEALVPALPWIRRYGIKVAVNAGASDARGLCEVVRGRAEGMSVAWVEGDEVMDVVRKKMGGKGERFENLCTGEVLGEWAFEPIYAQAYLGGLGIAEALRRGADIVICGRVSDASPVIAGAYWWHDWQRSDLEKLANAFVAGHLIECSTYVTGGNFTGFKALEAHGWDNLGFPIAEISASGQVVITKQKNTQGLVSVDTCTSQLLYEIQGPWYFNSDVTAILNTLWFEQVSPDRVALRGVRAGPPPPTTKVGITARGGFQAEFHYFLVGLDIDAKARMAEAQIRRAVGAAHAQKFTRFEFTKNGSAAVDAPNQNAASVDFRIFAQAREEADVAPAKFLRPCLDVMMQSYPGSTVHLDVRQGFPKQVFEYWVTLLPQADIKHKVHLHDGSVLDVAPPAETKVWDKQQPSQDTTSDPVDMESFGPTQRGPLGLVVHARSGDKGSDANVGFWVRHQDEYAWLRTLLSVSTLKQLLGDEDHGKKIDRFELPNARAVHFLLHDHLDRGVSCSSSYDFLAKNVAEFLRARWVNVPVRFVERSRI